MTIRRAQAHYLNPTQEEAAQRLQQRGIVPEGNYLVWLDESGTWLICYDRKADDGTYLDWQIVRRLSNVEFNLALTDHPAQVGILLDEWRAEVRTNGKP